ATRLDELVNGPAGTVPDRAGQPLDSWRLMLQTFAAIVENTRQNLIPLGKQYQSVEEAQADIANIPAGSTTYVRSQDGSALADEYLSDGATLTATGRRMPSQGSVDAIIQFIDKFIATGTVSGDFFPFFVDGAGNVPVYWDNGFAVSRIATSLYQMIYEDVHARLGDALNAQVTGVSPGFFPLFMDSAGNVPVYWNGGLDASAIATGLLEKIWAYING
ncbi:SGNH/GDSL hydrolase family protein, partial [Klebsiella pasteurii]|nr:SGNH/GDSL hydrolase family protein [Klebsiella pasteurii]MDD9671834.1 SGNH/GDSL hydrolase family protein [Klebsiella pasteurii]